jgi:hypothetical protein
MSINEINNHANEQMKYDIFISYSSDDSSIANELRDSLISKGFNCFMSEKDIPSASLWEDKIWEAIHLSKKVLLLITPRSKSRPWILLETGAAWALKKDLVPALMFVTPQELIEPIQKYQARIIETSSQRELLINELTQIDSVNQANLNGCWKDVEDNDIVFFQQRKNNVVGIYDFGERRKIGFYIGVIKGRAFEYEFKWYNNQYHGHGQMTLFDDNKTLSGRWWFGNDKASINHVSYEKIGDGLPNWLNIDDFNEHWAKIDS